MIEEPDAWADHLLVGEREGLAATAQFDERVGQADGGVPKPLVVDVSSRARAATLLRIRHVPAHRDLGAGGDALRKCPAGGVASWISGRDIARNISSYWMKRMQCETNPP